MKPAPFFILRTPLLDASYESGKVDEAWQRKEVREAISWASPSLAAAASGDGGTRDNARLAIARYLARMAGRPTPFSTMAGYSAGRVYGADTTLELSPREEYRRVARIDVETVQRLLLVAALADPATSRWKVRRDMLRFPDSLRIVAHSPGAEQVTSDIARSAAIDAVLAIAHETASFDDLVGTALRFASSPAAAERFVHALIENEALVPAASPSIFVSDEIQPLRDDARTRALADRLAPLRNTQLSGDLDLKAEIAPLALDPKDIIVDLVKPMNGEALLGRDVTRALGPIVDTLQRVELPGEDRRIAEFSRLFRARYQDREVSLVEALDPRRGIRFPAHRDLVYSPAAQAELERWKLSLFAEAIGNGGGEVTLQPAHIPAKKQWELAETCSVRFSLARDPWEIREPAVMRSPGTNFLVRGTAVLPDELCTSVRGFLAASAAHHPDEDTCDIAYFVPGRKAGQYPLLQPYAIILTSGGESSERFIDVNDIVLSMRATPRLRSRKTGRVLRIGKTNAANADRKDTTDVFRFLSALSSLGEAPGASWSWGALQSAPDLPRVRFDGHVLFARAWNVSLEETVAMRTASSRQARWDALQRLRQRRGLPRKVRFHEVHDHVLPVDLDDPDSVEAWLDTPHERMLLSEAFPVERSSVRGPEGTYHHEIVLPISGPVRASAEVDPDEAKPVAVAPFDEILPGDGVLYFRITGDSEVLLHLARRLVDEIVLAPEHRRKIVRWFFLPYTDVENELRLRVFGAPEDLWRGDLVASFRRLLDPLVRTRALRTVSIETYQRETYRYGGERGMAAAEELFQTSSEIALRLHGEYDLTNGQDVESYVAVLIGSLRAILRATGCQLDEQQAIVQLGIRYYGHFAEPAVSRALAGDLGRRLKEPTEAGESMAVTEEERARMATVIARVRSADALAIPFSSWMIDCLHVHITRLLTTWHPLLHLETVAYHLVSKLLAGEMHRRGSARGR